MKDKESYDKEFKRFMNRLKFYHAKAIIVNFLKESKLSKYTIKRKIDPFDKDDWEEESLE